MKRMKKADVEFHSDRGAARPAINVKCHAFGRGLTADALNCDDRTFEQACQFAFKQASERFWEDVQAEAQELFPGCKVYGEGRQGGWLVVHGLPDVETWDAIMLGKWARLARWCEREIAYLSGADAVREDIEANRWNEPGAEGYNFVDKRDGQTVCLSELKAQAIAAGFGAVIRKIA